jgi:hypothetical protein
LKDFIFDFTTNENVALTRPWIDVSAMCDIHVQLLPYPAAEQYPLS